MILDVELNRSAYEPLDVGSLSQGRVVDGASCSMANNSPDGGESMQGLAEMIQPAIGNLAASYYPRRATGLSSPLGC